MQGYQQPLHLSGKRKGSGESVWDTKRKLGLLTTEFHMEYADFADPSARGAGMSTRDGRGVSTWEVVCSGFHDSIGLYRAVAPSQDRVAREWVATCHTLGIEDLVTPPPPATQPE